MKYLQLVYGVYEDVKLFLPLLQLGVQLFLLLLQPLQLVTHLGDVLTRILS